MTYKQNQRWGIWIFWAIVVIAFLILWGWTEANKTFAKTPIDYQKWQLDDTTYVKTIGGSVRNYQKPDESWAEIDNDFEIEGDSVVYVDKAVLRPRVNRNGTSSVSLTWKGNEYTVTQKMLGIGWIKISTRQSQWIDSTMDWGNFSVDSNIAVWRGISPGVDYRVRKQNGTVQHGIFYKPAFVDSAVKLYDQRPDSLDIALANVMVYTLSSNIDLADSAIGDVAKRRLKDFGYYSFNLRDQRLNFPGSDTLPRIPVRQYWERRGDKIICIEYVMMRRIKQVHQAYPSATIWHNDSKTIDGTTNVEDTYMDAGGQANYNFGGSVFLYTDNGNDYRGLVRVKNVATELGGGATISDCVCSLYVEAGSGNSNAYSVFKPWNEGALDGSDPGDAAEGEGVATWNDWSNDGEEWTIGGCESADDGGSDNSGDGTGADRKATEESTVGVSGSTWGSWTISAGLAQAWYNGTKNEEGIFLRSANTVRYTSTESAETEKPFWVFTYSTGEVEAPSGRRRKIILNQ